MDGVEHIECHPLSVWVDEQPCKTNRREKNKKNSVQCITHGPPYWRAGTMSNTICYAVCFTICTHEAMVLTVVASTKLSRVEDTAPQMRVYSTGECRQTFRHAMGGCQDCLAAFTGSNPKVGQIYQPI
jgi:hypothetical protein